MDINQETRSRILAAANQLFEQAGRVDFPTVDAVRRAARANMNDASAVMKEWRRMQTATAAIAPVAVPDRVQQAGQTALAALWGEAQDLANESLKAAQAAWDAERAEAERLRVELSSAFEAQAGELDAAQRRLAELEAAAIDARQREEDLRGQLAATAERAGTAEARAAEIERRAGELKSDRDQAREEAARLHGQIEALSGAIEARTSELDALKHRFADLETRAAAAETAAGQREADLRLQIAAAIGRTSAAEARSGESERRAGELKADCDQARVEAGLAREEAARLRGQLDATQSQQAELMRALTGSGTAEH